MDKVQCSCSRLQVAGAGAGEEVCQDYSATRGRETIRTRCMVQALQAEYHQWEERQFLQVASQDIQEMRHRPDLRKAHHMDTLKDQMDPWVERVLRKDLEAQCMAAAAAAALGSRCRTKAEEEHRQVAGGHIRECPTCTSHRRVTGDDGWLLRRGLLEAQRHSNNGCGNSMGGNASQQCR